MLISFFGTNLHASLLSLSSIFLKLDSFYPWKCLNLMEKLGWKERKRITIKDEIPTLFCLWLPLISSSTTNGLLWSFFFVGKMVNAIYKIGKYPARSRTTILMIFGMPILLFFLLQKVIIWAYTKFSYQILENQLYCQFFFPFS